MDDQCSSIKGLLYLRGKDLLFCYTLDLNSSALFIIVPKGKTHSIKVEIIQNCSFSDMTGKLYADTMDLEETMHYSFDLILKNKVYAILSPNQSELETIRDSFISSSGLCAPLKYRKCCRICFGMGYIIALPYKLTDRVCSGIESVGGKLHRTPERIFNTAPKQRKKVIPSNIASGLLIGTKYMLSSLVNGITGLFYEPYKGAKESGLKGATLGFGKGILGLICEPVAGTLDFLALSVRGVNNTPVTVYKGLVKIYKKRKEKRLMKREDDAFFQQEIHEVVLSELLEPQMISIELIQHEASRTDLELVHVEEIELISTENVFQAMQLRNHQYEEWIHNIAQILNQVHTPRSVTWDEDDIIEEKLNEEKKRGQELRQILIEKLQMIAKDPTELTEQMPDEELDNYILHLLSSLGFEVPNPELIQFVHDFEEKLPSDEENYNIQFSPGRCFDGDLPCNTPSILSADDFSISLSLSPRNPLNSMLEAWKPIEATDQYRIYTAHPKGGIGLYEKAIHDKLKQAGKSILKTIGKKILKGDMNLTTVAFPISCMQPNTALYNSIKSFTLFPLYLSLAARTDSRIERMKFVTVANIATFKETSAFLKPLNPILGETMTASLEDGTMIYAEQTSHHPPISHFSVLGPQGSFRLNGYANYKATASFNSVTLINSGEKTVEFPDGQIIHCSHPEEVFNSTFIGQLRHETLGRATLTDKENQLQCILRFGNVNRKPSDFLEGVLVQGGDTVIGKLTGSYLGYLEWDGVRYWDARKVDPFRITVHTVLPSDSDSREDVLFLRDGDIERAQEAKDKLENTQRQDTELRKKYA